MSLLKPSMPDYDPLEWQRLPFAERVRLACLDWARQGYGSPPAIYLFYLLKTALYVLGWALCCTYPGGWSLAEIATWWAEPVAFQKAILWSMAFEGLGLGCASGPLTGRYMPPFGGFLHFLRPGTTKLPLVPGLGTRRTALDVCLYLTHYVLLARALLAPELTPALLLPTLALLPLMSLADRTLFLISRGEHYYIALACLLFVDWLPGNQLVLIAIWMWAAFSKLTPHFPSVLCVMTSNSPVLRFPWLRRAMYRDPPRDLRPSRLAVISAHMGTVVEFGFPILLAFGGGGPLTVAGLVAMVAFHTYITSNVPMAVPIEWNVMVVYSALVLFGVHGDTTVLDLSWPLAALLSVPLVLVPLIGNMVPRHVSFLPSMRYYAGNWPVSAWLFRGDASRKLNRVVKAAPLVRDQLALFYDEATIAALMSKVLAFRSMHLHGRALNRLLARAAEGHGRLEEYELIDGEIVAGLVLGWNFGDGHLHGEQLLAAVQEQCGFESAELRVVCLESQPWHRRDQEWRILDARDGELERGRADVHAMLEQQPWPEPAE